jgi:hypothetical protein
LCKLEKSAFNEHLTYLESRWPFNLFAFAEVPTYNELYYQDVNNQYSGYQTYPDQEYNAVNYQYTNNGYQISNGNNYQYFHGSKPATFYRRHKRTVEENNLVDTLHQTEQFECHARLICSMASGKLVIFY